MPDYKYYGKSGEVKWEGIEDVKANLRSIADKYPIDLGMALRNPVAFDILTESLRICPFDQNNPHEDGTPHLNETGQVEGPYFDENGKNPVVYITYTAPYALIQHEIQEYHHDMPEQWKYLEHPLNAAVATMAAKLMRYASLEESARQYIKK